MKRNPPSDKFDRFEDGSVRLPNGKVVDAETRAVRAPIQVRIRRIVKRNGP